MISLAYLVRYTSIAFLPPWEKEAGLHRNHDHVQHVSQTQAGQGAFKNFRVVPPGTGICHQVNLEYLAQTVWVDEDENENNQGRNEKGLIYEFMRLLILKFASLCYNDNARKQVAK